jgi:hypothetical protein
MGALIAGGMQLVGSANSAYDQAQEAARAKIEAADNTKMALGAAGDAIARGQKQAGLLRMQGGRLRAEQHVDYANSGVDSNVGTAASVMASTKALTELDAKTAENNAAAEAWGFRVHGMKFQQQAQLDAARSSNKIAGTLLTGGGRFASAASDYFSG